jgi:hypothetical protein
MLHLFTDGFTLSQALAYITGILFLVGALRKNARRIQISIPVRAEEDEKKAK